MSTLNSSNIQIGQSITPANNITLNTAVNGDLVVSKGAQGALTEISRISNSGLMDSSKVGYFPAGVGAVATTMQSKLRESVSVLDFGVNAIPGTTDMTLAFNLALEAYSLHKTVRVPAGIYLITGTLNLGINKKLIGDSSNSTVIKFNSTDSYCITGDAYTKIEGITVQKLSAGVATGIASYTPTDANGFRNGSLKDVVIIDFNVGIGSTRGIAAGLMFNNTYESVSIYNATTGVQMGAGSNTNTFINCSFWNCGNPLQLNNVTSQIFIGCNFENSTNYDFTVDAGYNIVFKSCYFEPATGGVFSDSTGAFTDCHSTDFKTPTTQFVTYSSNSTISIRDFTDYNLGSAASYVTQWYARSGDGTGYASKSNLRVRAGTAKADEITTPVTPYGPYTGSVSLANTATQTIVDMAGAPVGRYEVFAAIPASGSPVNYAAFATVMWDTSSARIVANNGGAVTISLSGTAVIVTNGTGSTFTFNYGYLRIGA
jgi:hypothetical protein